LLSQIQLQEDKEKNDKKTREMKFNFDRNQLAFQAHVGDISKTREKEKEILMQEKLLLERQLLKLSQKIDERQQTVDPTRTLKTIKPLTVQDLQIMEPYSTSWAKSTQDKDLTQLFFELSKDNENKANLLDENKFLEEELERSRITTKQRELELKQKEKDFEIAMATSNSYIIQERLKKDPVWIQAEKKET